MPEFKTPRWLQEELKRELGPARAPASLWGRIQNASPTPSAPTLHWARWAVAAALTVATSVGTYELPRPQWSASALMVPAGAPNVGPDTPADWDLRCTSPVRPAFLRVASISERRGHPFPVEASGTENDSMSCQACHSTGVNQHHL